MEDAETEMAAPEIKEETKAAETRREVVRGAEEIRGGVPDTLPHPLNLVVTAIMSMETRLGTAWPPQPAPGWTSAFHDPEV